MLKVLNQKSFALLWCGQLISLFGDWMSYITLPFYVYQRTNSTLATGILFIVATLPRIVFGSFAGVFVDRWNHKKTMVSCDILRAVISLLLFTLPLFDWIWMAYIVAFVNVSISQFFEPAKNVIIPKIVDKENLHTANALSSISDNVTRLLAASIGGTLLGLLGLSIVISIDVFSFIFSAVLLAMININSDRSETADRTNDDATTVVKTFWEEWIVGLKIVKETYVVTIVFIIISLVMLAEGIFSVLFLGYVKDILGLGAIGFGWIMAARGVSGLIGGLLIGRLKKLDQPYYLIFICSSLIGVLFLIIFNFPFLPLAIVVLCVMGIPGVALMVTTQTLLQQNIEESFRGRVFGSLNTTTSLLMLIGLIIASIFGDIIGIVPILNFACGFYLVSSLIVLLALRKSRLIVYDEVK